MSYEIGDILFTEPNDHTLIAWRWDGARWIKDRVMVWGPRSWWRRLLDRMGF